MMQQISKFMLRDLKRTYLDNVAVENPTEHTTMHLSDCETTVVFNINIIKTPNDVISSKATL